MKTGFPFQGFASLFSIIVGFACVHACAAADQFALTLGQTVSAGFPGVGAGNIEASGAEDVYTFTVGAGQRVYFDALTGSPCAPTLRWNCTGPTNELIFNQPFAAYSNCGNGDPGTRVLTNAGTYTVTVSGYTDATGPYAFAVVPVVPQTFPITPGQVVTNSVPGSGAGSIESAGAIDTYTFTVGAG